MVVMLVWLCGVLVAYWTSPVSPVTESSTAAPALTTETNLVLCTEETVDGYDWPSTAAGENASTSCPDGTQGQIYRFCEDDATWTILDFTRCTSPTLTNLQTEATNIVDSASEYLLLAEDLQNASKPAKIVFSGDLLAAISIMYNLIEDSFLISCNATASVVENFTNISDANAVLTLMQKLDSFSGDVLACLSQVNVSKIQVLSSNLDVSLEVFQTSSDSDIVFPTSSNSDTNQVTVPVAILSDTDALNKKGVSIISYKTLKTLLPSSDINNRLTSLDGALNSEIMSITLYPTQSSPTSKPIQLKFAHLLSGSDPVCALMDFTLTASIWNVEECETASTSSDVTTCNCFEASNFALLMTLDNGTTTKVPLNPILATGVIISLLFLVATFVLLLFVNRNLESDWALIVKCFLLTFVLSQITFLSGINATDNKFICRMVGIILHYLYLSVFFWMLAQAVQLQLKIVQASANPATISHYCLLGWVTPLLVVASAAGLKHEKYGHEQYCWLSIWDKVIYAFIGPVAFILVVTISVLCTSLHGCVTIMRTDQKGSIEMMKLKPAFRAILVTLPMLAITWTLQSFAIDINSEVLYTVFALCYITQAMMIFVLYGVLDDQVQALYRSKFGHNHKAVQDSSNKMWNDKSEHSKTSPSNFRASSVTSFSSRASESVINRTDWNDSTASLSSSTARRLKKNLVIPLKRTAPSPTPSQTQGTSSRS
ncbi:adhesion G protein-coupled receptor B1-like [Glandiceps talaboti]